ncbi:MAG: hypothetical protein MH204_04715 [Fimbriimonadaceae bacterium]|nr:hypothetical protein [Fimbriimonadaceae bacterium]
MTPRRSPSLFWPISALILIILGCGGAGTGGLNGLDPDAIGRRLGGNTYAWWNHFESDDRLPTLSRAQEVGIRTLRLPLHYNDWVQTAPAERDGFWARLKQFDRDVKTFGIRPQWTILLGVDGSDDPWPKGAAALAQLTEFKNRLWAELPQAHIQVENEVNLHDSPTDRRTLADIDDLIECVKTIAAGRPASSRLVAPSVTTFQSANAAKALAPLEALRALEGGLGGLVDSYAIHPYADGVRDSDAAGSGQPEAKFDEVAALIAALNGRPFIFSEAGVASFTTNGVSQKRQADWMLRSFLLGLIHGAGSIQLYEVRDREGQCINLFGAAPTNCQTNRSGTEAAEPQELHFGLFTGNLQNKEASVLLRDFMTEFENAKLLDHSRSGGRWTLTLEKEGVRHVVRWAQDSASATAEFPLRPVWAPQD